MFRLIVISSPAPVPQEAAIINRLFDAGLELLHVRKPDMSEHELSELLNGIDPGHRPKLALHQHYQLSGPFGIRRLHLPERQRLSALAENSTAWKDQGYTLSTSIHALKDHDALPHVFDYAFYGPVFESISKQGYLPTEAVAELPEKNAGAKLIAIGGITPARLQQVKQLGFNGAAMLGAIWDDPHKALATFETCREKSMPAQSC